MKSTPLYRRYILEDTLLHIGVKRRSGRYPYGSGGNPYQHESWTFLSKVDDLKGKGYSQKQIAEELGLTTTQLRTKITWANKEVRTIQRQKVEEYHSQGLSNVDIGKALGISEGTVRNIISFEENKSATKLDATVSALVRGVEENGYLDVGVGVERQLGVSKEKLKAARQKLLDEGYYEHEIYVRQVLDRNKMTTIKVLTKEPDLEVVKKNSDKIRSLEQWSEDNGNTLLGIRPPESVSWDRVKIVYDEDGGSDKDGLMELRRNVKDLDLGTSRYAQVRIAVGDTHFLKGMAAYADENFPPGVDIIFNTNKKKGTPKEAVLKALKENKDNPFGTTISRQKGALNIVNEEGDWYAWKGKLSSQMLGKQPLKLIQERLDTTYSNIMKEYGEIISVSNPLIKKHLLTEFSDGLATKARDLKLKGLARTKNHVILPYPDMDPSEVYAPGYRNGERVVLIRHPHGGIFEIPELTVNNNGPAKKSLGNAIDAIGIHPSVAKKLSGADFDGDTVLVIPNNSRKIKSSRSLTELRNFDTMKYKVDYDTMNDRTKQTQMGLISNLITDMTLKNAPQADIAAAVRHSMVVIDAQKHKLDYKQSAIDNNIAALKKRYQSHTNELTGKPSRGASTLLSKASSRVEINEAMTKAYNQQLKDKGVKQKSAYVKPGAKLARMDLVDDARKLSSGTGVEEAYAGYANKLKSLQNTTYKQAMSIKPVVRDPKAATYYKNEVASLDKKINAALLNAPRERQAQLLATKTYYKNVTPDMSKDEKKRLRVQALQGARQKTIPNGKKERINVTPKEWEAIQAGAVSNEKLTTILKNSNKDQLVKYATPRTSTKLSSAKLTRAKLLLNKGYSFAEVASQLGTTTTIIKGSLEGESQ